MDWIKSQLKKKHLMHCDETGMRVNGKNVWLHNAFTSEYTYQTVHQKRGSEGMNAARILQHFFGIFVHDCFSHYWTYSNSQYAICGAHILRGF